MLASKGANDVIGRVRSLLSQQNVPAFDPLSNAYQNADGSSVVVTLNSQKTMYLDLDISQGQVIGMAVEKISVSGTKVQHEILNFNANAMLEITTQNGVVQTRTGIIRTTSSEILSSMFSSKKIQLQTNAVQWLDGGSSPPDSPACTAAYNNMLTANRALGTAIQNLNTAAEATGLATGAGAGAGLALGGPLGALGGAIVGFAGSVPFYATAVSQYHDAQSAWQQAALDVRTC